MAVVEEVVDRDHLDLDHARRVGMLAVAVELGPTLVIDDLKPSRAAPGGHRLGDDRDVRDAVELGVAANRRGVVRHGLERVHMPTVRSDKPRPEHREEPEVRSDVVEHRSRPQMADHRLLHAALEIPERDRPQLGVRQRQIPQVEPQAAGAAGLHGQRPLLEPAQQDPQGPRAQAPSRHRLAGELTQARRPVPGEGPHHRRAIEPHPAEEQLYLDRGPHQAPRPSRVLRRRSAVLS